MSLRNKLQMAGISDVGLRRGHNEDRIATDPRLGLAVLADGMGGYRAGEVASAMAVSVIVEELRKGLRHNPPQRLDEDSGYTLGSLLVREAIGRANESIYQAAQEQPQCQGMGTTLVSLLFYDNQVSVAHVGDSRLYRLRRGEIEQLTADHSLMQELIDRGFYTPEEARRNVQKNLVTRAVGVDPTVNADLQEEPVLPGDLYLLCSDGLSDLVDDEGIRTTLTRYGNHLPEAAERLVQQANANGGTDNISVILVRALRPFPARRHGGWYSRMLDWFT
jgi:protein phosphatase